MSTDSATAAGYKQVTECVEHQPDGAMGYHFQNNALLDTTLDVEHPEVPCTSASRMEPSS